MRMIEWAFGQDIPHSEKLVLVYLAANASAQGVGIMNRASLMAATRYKPRSIQRLLKSLRGGDLLVDIGGDWYRIGSLTDPNYPHTHLMAGEIGEMPDDLPPLLATDSPIVLDGEDIAQTIGDYLTDQLNNFIAQIDERLDRATMFHVDHQASHVVEEEPPDPVLENPIYQTLIDTGQAPERAYALSKADLAMGEELDHEPALLDVREFGAIADYPDNAVGRYKRILYILHGPEAPNFDISALRHTWNRIEEQENKHTQTGEVDAFELVYPAIVDAARVFDGTIEEFIEPKCIARGEAPWDQELNPIDKDSPELMTEIAVMLAELEAAQDPRCTVQPRTKETGDDGVTREETVLGWHRRVTAKHNEMLRLQQMGVI